MSKTAVCCLAGALFAAAVANTLVVDLFGRDRELYPMTAWQMFSGKPKVAAREFVFEVLAEPGAAPIEVPATRLTGLAGSRGRRVAAAIWKSCRHHCPDYRLKDYDKCRECAVERWTLPRDVGQEWVRRAVRSLRLRREPYSIRLVMVMQPLPSDSAPEVLQPTRTIALTWQPRSGSYEVESGP